MTTKKPAAKKAPARKAAAKKAAPVAMSNAERQAAYRAARAAAGLVEVRGIYAHPDDVASLKASAARLAKKRAA